MRTRTSLIIVLLTVLFLFGSCDFFFDHFEDWEDPDTPSEPVEPGEDGDNDDNVLLGLPSQPSLADGTKLIEHSAYTVLYSYDLLMPIWVSWHLDASDSGDFPRPSRFSPATVIVCGSVLSASHVRASGVRLVSEEIGRASCMERL